MHRYPSFGIRTVLSCSQVDLLLCCCTVTVRAALQHYLGTAAVLKAAVGGLLPVGFTTLCLCLPANAIAMWHDLLLDLLHAACWCWLLWLCLHGARWRCAEQWHCQTAAQLLLL